MRVKSTPGRSSANRCQISVVICPTVDGAPVASLNVSTGPRGGYEVGWCVAEGHRRLGYASAMAEAVLGVLFAAGAPSVSCAIDAWNVPSLRTAARIGFEAGRAGPDGSATFTLTQVVGRSVWPIFTQVAELKVIAAGRKALSPFAAASLAMASSMSSISARFMSRRL